VWIFAAIGLGIGAANGMIFNFFTTAANWLIEAMALAPGNAGAGGGFAAALHNFWSQLGAAVGGMLLAGHQGTPGHPSTFSVLFGGGLGPAMEALLLGLEIDLMALLLLAGGAIITVGALFVYLSAVMGLMACLALAPIFVVAGGFEKTARFFDAWLSQTLNFVILIGLVGMLFGLSMATANHILAQVHAFTSTLLTAQQWEAAIGDLAVDMVAWVMLAVLLYYFYYQLPSLASGLVGGVGLQHPADWMRQRMQTISEGKYLWGGRRGGASPVPAAAGGSLTGAAEDQAQTRVGPPV
jgi:type IV secretory pathway VirB6-like protein